MNAQIKGPSLRYRALHWLLDRLEFKHIHEQAWRRGKQVIIPHDYAYAAFPREMTSGWWPVREFEPEAAYRWAEQAPR